MLFILLFNEAYEDCFCCPIFGQCALNTCLDCSEGFYNSNYNQSSCKKCDIGTYSKYEYNF